MELNRSLEQHVAVFGESGSGKTVLVSSFYGATQEPEFLEESFFRVVAEDFGQRSRLHQNYLGMKDAGRVPPLTRFASTPYAFTLKFKASQDAKLGKTQPFNSLRLVWHDYPGEWFETEVSGPEEARRRVEAFRALLGSDVAILLIDGQRLLENTGEEERYLKHLFATFSNGLLALKDDVLDEGKRLVDFPRIWVLGLSKADLLPDLNVFGFRDLIMGKVGRNLAQLREVISTFIDGDAALSVGDDYVLLSSAKFTANDILVGDRIGVDLVVPLAAVLPLERHVQWADSGQLPKKVAEHLLTRVGPLAEVLVGLAPKLPGPVGVVAGLVGAFLPRETVVKAAEMAEEKIKELNRAAIARKNYLTASLSRFRLDLAVSEKARILLRGGV